MAKRPAGTIPPQFKKGYAKKVLPKDEQKKEDAKKASKIARQRSDVERSRSRLKAEIAEFIDGVKVSQRFKHTQLYKVSDMAKNMFTELAYNTIKVLCDTAGDLVKGKGGMIIKAGDIRNALLLLIRSDMPKGVNHLDERAEKLYKKFAKLKNPEDETKKKEAVYSSIVFKEEGVVLIPNVILRIANFQSGAGAKLVMPGAVALAIFIQDLIEDVMVEACKTSKKAGEDSWIMMPVHVQRGIQRSSWLNGFVSSNHLLGQFQFRIPQEIDITQVEEVSASRKRKTPSKPSKSSSKSKFGWGASKKSPYAKKTSSTSVLKMLSDVDSDYDDDFRVSKKYKPDDSSSSSSSSDSDSDSDFDFLKTKSAKRSTKRSKKAYSATKSTQQKKIDDLEKKLKKTVKDRKELVKKIKSKMSKLKADLKKSNDELASLKSSGASSKDLKDCRDERDAIKVNIDKTQKELDRCVAELNSHIRPKSAWAVTSFESPPTYYAHGEGGFSEEF